MTTATHTPTRPAWDRLQEELATEPLRDMIEAHPAIGEALTLIKHAGPEARHAEALTVALGLLVDVTVQVARGLYWIEPNLVTTCNLLHEHLETLGLTRDAGRWTVRAWGAPVAPEIAALAGQLHPAGA